MIVDGHLDLAHGVNWYKRDLAQHTPHAMRALEREAAKAGHLNAQDLERGLAMVSLSELKRGQVGLVFATLFATPAESWVHPGQQVAGGYSNPSQAHAQAMQDLRVYEDWAAQGLVRLIQSRSDLAHHTELWPQDQTPGLVILMEGCDPIETPAQAAQWWQRGVRIFGTSWGRTRYAGGTDAPGGLTDIGTELVQTLAQLGAILDVSHQSWEAFWHTLEVAPSARVIASHSNAYALTPTGNRHLSDDMIRAIGARDGRVGVVMFNRFLEPRWTREDRSVPVSLGQQVRHHMQHIADLIGWERVCIGSDIDGGLGELETPEELHTIADLQRIGGVVPDHAKANVLGKNWLRLLREALP